MEFERTRLDLPSLVICFAREDPLSRETYANHRFGAFAWISPLVITRSPVITSNKKFFFNIFLLVKPYGEKIVHSGVKAPNLAW